MQGEDIWEKGVDIPLYVRLHSEQMRLSDLVIEVQDIYDTPVVVKTKEDFTEIAPGVWKTLVNVPEQIAKGDYDLIAHIKERQYATEHTRTYNIVIRNKRISTHLYDFNDAVLYYLRAFFAMIFG